MWRHGDVLLATAETIPEEARRLHHTTLAYGELTGHSHRIKEAKAAELYALAGQLFLKVIADRATLIHEEHGPIELKPGIYRVWMQREYSPEAIRRIID